MIDIPLSLRVPPQGRYNRGIYTVMNVISNRRTIRSTLHAGPCRDLCRYDGRLECPRCGQKWMFHYRAQNSREAHDYAAQLLAYRTGDPDWRMTLNPDWIAVPRQKKE